jgi:putative ATPase
MPQSLFDGQEPAAAGDAESSRSAAPPPRRAPLADRMRPRRFEEFVGQEGIIGPRTVLRRAVARGELSSLILWGPPGSGKTTLARLLAAETGHHFAAFSAVTSGVAEVRRIIREAEHRMRFDRRGTILFVDEIHRFNRAQQDAFLPHVEAGTVTLVGATTENPSFEVNSALLSRCRVFVLEKLGTGALLAILRRALADVEHGLGELQVLVPDEVLEYIARLADGDARVALNALELAALAATPDRAGRREVGLDAARDALQKRTLVYDKDREEHYNIISALHKALRGSDVQAGLYWLGRMLCGGEDPLYIARRLVRFASEDIGMADPQALVVAIAARDACHFLGMPECDTALAQLVVYLATAPKSNAVYRACGRVKREIERSGALPVPMHIRNAPTGLMKDLGYGAGYAYDHDSPQAFSGQEFLPAEVAGAEFYGPREFGFEREVRRRMEYWARLRRERRAPGAAPESRGPEAPGGGREAQDAEPGSAAPA